MYQTTISQTKNIEIIKTQLFYFTIKTITYYIEDFVISILSFLKPNYQNYFCFKLYQLYVFESELKNIKSNEVKKQLTKIDRILNKMLSDVKEIKQSNAKLIIFFLKNNCDNYQLLIFVFKRCKSNKIEKNFDKKIVCEKDVNTNKNRFKKKFVKKKSKKKIIKSIVNIIKKFKVNVKKLLNNNTIILSIIYFYQILSFFRDKIKRIIQIFKKFRRKKKKKKKIIEVV